jgi:hypothetical protein
MSAALCGRSAFTEAKIWSADLVHLNGRGFWLWPIDESSNIGFELPDGGMNTALEPLSCELSEPALDLIDP